MSSDPRVYWPASRITTVTWMAVAGPVLCACGHVHYGWVPDTKPVMAPQWGYCTSCDCTCLRKGYVEQHPERLR